MRCPAGRSDFVGGEAHVAGREKLPLLDVDRPARAARGDEQVGLAAQKGRDLENVADLRGGFGLRRLVDIGQHGQAGLGP